MNEDVKQFATDKGVRLWELAARLGVNDSNLSRKLRVELSPEERSRMLWIIDDIAAEHLGVDPDEEALCFGEWLLSFRKTPCDIERDDYEVDPRAAAAEDFHKVICESSRPRELLRSDLWRVIARMYEEWEQLNEEETDGYI